ncbi:MAG: nitrite/sulfite reductase [Candidatus Binatia bacterium]|nr:nitrite/sulfite reductase [Candidatus Binatia bacterium]MDG1960001.1 nitrite/sulfite reductase [Candidatus Binatia bacterium]MDG2009787.1 nitrite/sulfite reductase [Candidatus Binatia bacterium]
MYKYSEYDSTLVRERAQQFRDQVSRRLSGELTEDEFKPLRLQNGLYLQLHAYMLRVAIPYGLLAAQQMRKLAHIARTYDRGYGHFTTRQNIQFNWPELEQVPTILDELAEVEMHAIQTSGNCIRNTTTDHLAGVARDELADPRPYCEMVRQWSTFHPEFAFLPRKFKIAFTGSADSDRAAIRLHDIGIQLVENEDGELGFRVFVGGGMGRTPKVGKLVREFLPRQHLISYLEAILRVYNQLGRRDNIYKARIKILVDALGVPEFSALVEKEWEEIRESSLQVTDAEVERMQAFFAPPAYETLPDSDAAVAGMQAEDTPLGQWARNNVVSHKQSGYSAVVLSLKSYASPSGDLSDKQMEAVADLSEQYGFGEIIVTHTQDLVLPDVRSDALEALFTALVDLDIATPNHNRLTDLICCPGLDFCNLANARSIPVAQEIRQRFDDIDYLDDLGEMSLKISGCINACGHHHVGTIGILGIDKRGEEAYQLMLGGSAGHDASLGKVLGQAFSREEIVPALEKALKTYVKLRESPEETFIETFRRLGDKPFREGVYGA